MISLANKIAGLVAAITCVMCLLANISILNCLIRTGVVFVGMLFAFYLSGQILKLGLILLTPQKEGDV